MAATEQVIMPALPKEAEHKRWQKRSQERVEERQSGSGPHGANKSKASAACVTSCNNRTRPRTMPQMHFPQSVGEVFLIWEAGICRGHSAISQQKQQGNARQSRARRRPLDERAKHALSASRCSRQRVVDDTQLVQPATKVKSLRPWPTGGGWRGQEDDDEVQRRGKGVDSEIKM